MLKIKTKSEIKQFVGVKQGLMGSDLLPDKVKIGAAGANKFNNFRLVFEGETDVKVEKTVSVTTDKINLLLGHMKTISSRSGDVFPPFLGSFGVVDPGAGQKLKTKIKWVMKETAETKTPMWTQSGKDSGPIRGRNSGGVKKVC